MKTTKESNYFSHFERLIQGIQQFARDWQHVIKAWYHLLVQLLVCLGMTAKMLFRSIFWILRQLLPIPSPVNPYQERYRNRRSTGIPIPAMEVSMLALGTVIVLGRLW